MNTNTTFGNEYEYDIAISNSENPYYGYHITAEPAISGQSDTTFAQESADIWHQFSLLVEQLRELKDQIAELKAKINL